LTSQPHHAGAYPIEVKVYDQASGASQNRQYVLRVLERPAEDNMWAYETDNYYERSTEAPLRIVLNQDSRSTAHVGEDFHYQINTENANGETVYGYFGLPNGIYGDQERGVLTGRFSEAGVFTFALETADQSGNSAEGFLTISVIEQHQTQTELSNVQLDTRVTYNFDLEEIRREQIAADRELFDALAVVNAAKAKLASRQVAFNQLEAELALAET
jgi:hypothetical protein